MTTRDRILARIRRAVPAPAPDEATPEAALAAIPRDYLRVHDATWTPARTADLLAANLTEYRAKVHRTDEAGLPPLLARLLSGSRTVLIPPALPPHWLSGTSATLVPDQESSNAHDLDGVDSTVTGCALAIAETGTIVLDGGPDQGRRRITLIPDHHVCVVRVPSQVVDSVPQALERLDPTRPLTWISGPSATSDIELDRVEGVHGPRTLDVILLGAQ
ncbi:LutC/YkgG family protein [Streptomyces katrae]|uniref:Lactate utilization protein B/C n=1 Tax=Streptomyces katrae TaxID=68223 RepID=A0A0F4JXE0_9ACTN|nr:LUD domain-containing protein [Streptomyces katrae]KJY39027.1 lactate utilization protein B/C [Streptomyces katrae]